MLTAKQVSELVPERGAPEPPSGSHVHARGNHDEAEEAAGSRTPTAHAQEDRGPPPLPSPRHEVSEGQLTRYGELEREFSDKFSDVFGENWHHVASRVYAFLAAFDIERSIDEAAYENHVSSLVSRKREPFANLADEANAHWATMYDAEYDFGRSLREAEAVARISRAELAAFYNAHVRPCARRCVFLDGGSGAKAVEGDRRELLVVVAPKKGDAALDAATLRSRMAGACVDGSAVLSPDHVDGDAHAYGCGLPRW